MLRYTPVNFGLLCCFQQGVVAICTVVAVPLFRKFFNSMITNETEILPGDYDTNAYFVLNTFGVKINILYLFNVFHCCVTLVFISLMNFIITKIGHFESFSGSRLVSIASKYSSVILTLKVYFIFLHKLLFGCIFGPRLHSLAVCPVYCAI